MQTSRGSKGNGASSAYAGLNGSRTGGNLSYGQIEGSLLQQCVERVTNHGDAILFGRTSDGGALSVHVLSNGRADKFYVTDASELMELLLGLIAAVSDDK